VAPVGATLALFTSLVQATEGGEGECKNDARLLTYHAILHQDYHLPVIS
jgi:hypothetical protein